MKIRTIGLSVTVLLTAACSLAQDRAPKRVDNLTVYSELAKAPEKAVSRQNPFEHDAQAITAGRMLFQRHCSECHGDDAQGTKKAPSLRAQEVQKSQPGAIFWILTNGVVRRGMPVWSKLPEPQRWQLVSFIKSLDALPKSDRGTAR